MSVTAKKLSKSGTRSKDLEGLIVQQLQIIDDKLLHSDKTWGRNVVTYDLPTSLAFPGLDRADIQRFVYSAILRSLDQRGFEVRILIEDARSILYIAWMTDLSIDEVEAMNAIIRANIIMPNDVEKFMSRGRAPAPHSVTAARQGARHEAKTLKVVNQKEMTVRGGMVKTAEAPAAPAAPAAAPPPMTDAEKALMLM